MSALSDVPATAPLFYLLPEIPAVLAVSRVEPNLSPCCDGLTTYPSIPESSLPTVLIISASVKNNFL